MRRGVSSVAQPGWALRASPFSGSTGQDGQSRPAAPAPSDISEIGTSGPRLRRSPFHPTARCAPNPRNGQPLFTCHTGFQRPRPAAPRSASSRTPAPRPGRRQRAGRACGRQCRHWMRGAFLSLDSPSRTYFLLAAASYDRPQPRFLREQHLFCFRCEISASGAARPKPRPKGFAAVVISGSGVVGGWPAGEGVGSRGGRDETKGVGLPVVWARIVRVGAGGKPAL